MNTDKKNQKNKILFFSSTKVKLIHIYKSRIKNKRDEEDTVDANNKQK